MKTNDTDLPEVLLTLHNYHFIHTSRDHLTLSAKRSARHLQTYLSLSMIPPGLSGLCHSSYPLLDLKEHPCIHTEHLPLRRWRVSFTTQLCPGYYLCCSANSWPANCKLCKNCPTLIRIYSVCTKEPKMTPWRLGCTQHASIHYIYMNTYFCTLCVFLKYYQATLQLGYNVC